MNDQLKCPRCGSFACQNNDCQRGVVAAPTASNGGGTATMNFVQFAGTHNPAPKNMAVGEIIISIAQDGNMYTIRRDK